MSNSVPEVLAPANALSFMCSGGACTCPIMCQLIDTIRFGDRADACQSEAIAATGEEVIARC